VPPTFAFAMLGVVQLALGIAGIVLTLVVTLLPSARLLRGRLLGAVVGATAGPFLGVVTAYLVVLVVLLIHQRIVQGTADSHLVGYVTVGCFFAGYAFGAIIGGRIGWLRGQEGDAAYG
jgi:hypothetical protein